MYFKLPPNPWYTDQKLYPQTPVFKVVSDWPPDDGKTAHWHRNPGEELRDVIPELFTFEPKCPAEGCNVQRMSLYAQIQHLNDEHEWTREAIADWLETLPVDLTFKMHDKESDDVLIDS